jgi:hypothetical protein
MSKHLSRTELVQAGMIVELPELRRNLAERSFGLHPALFAATIGAYLAFLAIMATVFVSPELVIPFGICFVYVAMAFGTPAMWARISPRPEGRYQTWAEFREEGVETATGKISSGGAIAQVLVLPMLIVGWALAIGLIKALV